MARLRERDCASNARALKSRCAGGVECTVICREGCAQLAKQETFSGDQPSVESWMLGSKADLVLTG